MLTILFVSLAFSSCIEEKAVTVTDMAIDSSNINISTDSPFDSSYAHIVYFWLKNPNSVEDRKAFETALVLFLETSEYAKTNFIGTPPVASREVVDDSFTYNLVVTFASAEAQEKYQEEASHKKFIDDASHLWNKVIVYDATSIH